MATVSWLGPAVAAGQTSAAIPRAADGKPNLSGIWQAMNTAAWDLQDHSGRLGVPAGQGVVEGNEIPVPAGALKKKQENFANRATADPESKCYLPGVPRATYMGFPFQILQRPGGIMMAYEYAHAVRRIYMNSPHPKGPIEWWMGDSRGRWEGDTLVVDVVHFTDMTWFDRAGNFHSELLHVVERYTPAGPDHIQYRRRSRIPRCSRGRGRSACCSTGARSRARSSWNTSATAMPTTRRDCFPNPLPPGEN